MTARAMVCFVFVLGLLSGCAAASSGAAERTGVRNGGEAQSSQSRDESVQKGEPFELSLERHGGCSGVCPMYRVTVDHLGEVEFLGMPRRATVGHASARVDSQTVASVRQALSTVEFGSLLPRYGRDQCPTSSSGGEWSSFELTNAAGSSSVAFYHGCESLPEVSELVELGRTLERLLATERWTRFPDGTCYLGADVVVLYPHGLSRIHAPDPPASPSPAGSSSSVARALTADETGVYAYDALGLLVSKLEEVPSTRIEVHSQASREEAPELAEERAGELRRVLQELGAPMERVSAAAHGHELSPGEDPGFERVSTLYLVGPCVRP